MAARHLSWLQRGHDEARVGLALCPFRLGDHAPPSAPALPGRPAQVLEAPRRLARPSGLLLGLDQLDRDLLDEAIVAGEPEHVVDPVLLAPGHQDLAGEARVGPRTRGQRAGIGATIRSPSATAPAEASMLERRSLAARRWRPQNT